MEQSFTFNLPIKVVFAYPEKLDPVDITKHIISFLTYYSDGRNNLERECIDRDLSTFVKDAVQNVIYQKAKELYGKEMVQVSPKCKSSKAMIVSMENNKKVSFCVGFIDESDF